MRSKLQQLSLIIIGLVGGVMLSLNIPAIAQKQNPTPLPVEELRNFAEVFSAIKQGYVEPIDDKLLITHAIRGMLANLDPHSAYLDADTLKDLRVSTQGEFGGLGIEVGMEDGLVRVVAPIEDTPAWRAGVKSGDLIFKLDDTPVRGMTLGEAVKIMRGKPKTSIKLTILRKDESKPLEIAIERAVIKVRSVKSKLVEPAYGYLRITQFQDETGADVVKHLNQLIDHKDNKDAGLKGLVLDLRNDPGGLLFSAIAVSSAFLPEDSVVVTTNGRIGDSNRKYLATASAYLRQGQRDFIKDLNPAARNVPMIVLVNGGSASASEIVAGALQDHKRAIIMGTQTFGKGSVQTVLPLSENQTAIKLTTARYYTPSGKSIQAKGIEPDILVEEGSSSRSPLRVREADLNRHLSNDKEKSSESEKPQNKQDDEVGQQTDDETSDQGPVKFASKEDAQLMQAINLLKALQVVKR